MHFVRCAHKNMHLDKKHIAAMRKTGFDDEQIALSLGVKVSDLPLPPGKGSAGEFTAQELEDEILQLGLDFDNVHPSIRLKALQYLHAERLGRNVTAVTQGMVATEQQKAVIININGAVRQAVEFRKRFQESGSAQEAARLLESNSTPLSGTKSGEETTITLKVRMTSKSEGDRYGMVDEDDGDYYEREYGKEYAEAKRKERSQIRGSFEVLEADEGEDEGWCGCAFHPHSLRVRGAGVYSFGLSIGKTFSRSSAGRGITCTPISSPTRRAAAAPASVAAFTEPTSPRTMAVTRPASTFCQPTKITLAAFTMASAASIMPTSPRVSTMPSASPYSCLGATG